MFALNEEMEVMVKSPVIKKRKDVTGKILILNYSHNVFFSMCCIMAHFHGNFQ